MHLFQVCIYDPCSDDPRLALKKVVLCPVTGTLVVAGTAGHVVVTKLDLEPKEKKLEVSDNNLNSGSCHKRQRRKRQSVTAKREKSQTPKLVPAILTYITIGLPIILRLRCVAFAFLALSNASL